jgi:prepilin-type N-terminal cleavage/methylation domain-containing protein
MLSLKNNKKGFTIIEVLIVLAIAGVIMVVVFLAVPALQRNSRNNEYKTEAGRILAATSEFISNLVPLMLQLY